MTTPNVSLSAYSTIITQTTLVQKEEAERLTCRLSPLYVKPTWTTVTVILYGSIFPESMISMISFVSLSKAVSVE